MELILMAIATVFNFIILRLKYARERYEDLSIDVIVLVTLTWMFGGTMSGMVVAMIASMFMSIYLWFFPPKF